jgi:hypothetical protein
MNLHIQSRGMLRRATIYARIKIMLTAFVEEAVVRAPSHEWAAELKCKNIQKCKSSFYYEMCAHAIRAPPYESRVYVFCI